MLGVGHVAAVGVDQVEHAAAGGRRRSGAGRRARGSARRRSPRAAPASRSRCAATPAASIDRGDDHRAGQGDVGAVGLRAPGGGCARRPAAPAMASISSSMPRARQKVAVQLVQAGSGSARWCIRGAACRIVPPTPTIRPPAPGEPAARSPSPSRPCGAAASGRSGTRARPAGSARSCARHRAGREIDLLERRGPRTRVHLDAAAAEVEHVAVAEGRASSPRRGSRTRPPPRPESTRTSSAPSADSARHGLLAVRGVARGAGRDRRDVVDLGGLAEGRVEAGGVLGALQGVAAQARLVGAPPTAARRGGSRPRAGSRRPGGSGTRRAGTCSSPCQPPPGGVRRGGSAAIT